jgi:hypothetical protein
MCNVLQGWIVAFQPGTTLAQAEALFDANELIWEPLAWDRFRMAVISVPLGHWISVISAIQNSPDVKYVEPDWIREAY